MLQIHQPLSRKLRTYSVLALMGIGVPLMVYGMTVTPKYEKVSAAGDTRTLADISTMQEMTGDICSNTKIGMEATLTDNRDGNMYIVRRLVDGNCWMVQNLQLVGGKTINNIDSDLNNISSYTLPAAKNAFKQDNTVQQIKDYTDEYGSYYSWCTATAGTCQDNGKPLAIDIDAASSICPKGWKLPKGGADGDFWSLFAKYPNEVSSQGFQINDNKNGFWLGDSMTITGGTFFLAAGAVGVSGLLTRGELGNYWSRTSNGDDYAYVLYFNSAGIFADSYSVRWHGNSIRCLAYSEPREGNANVNVSVSPMLTIDATAGMKSEVEASKVATGTIEARITANTPYRVLLSSSATNPGNKTTMYRRTDSMEEGSIPTYDTTSSDNIPASSNVVPNTNAWGIDNSCNKDGSNLAYLPITTLETEYCNTTSIDETTQATIHKFGIGISVSPSLSSGTYETSVTVTGVGS